MSRDRFPNHIMELMRRDVADLAADPDQALRLVMRLSARLASLDSLLTSALRLNTTEYRALMALWDGGRCSLGDLSRRVGLSRSGMTTVADNIEARGLAERVPDPEDRRRVMMFATPRFEAELWKQATRLTASLRKVASEDDWAAFGRITSKLREVATTESGLLAAELAARDEPSPSVSRRGRPPQSIEKST